MDIKFRRTGHSHPESALQRGIITTFTGVLILLLLTLMMFFALRVGVFDQRNSSNEMRQKLAFHAAESAIANAKEFLRANSLVAASLEPSIQGTSGWLSSAAGALRWQKCSEAGLNLATGSGTHPCFGEPNPDRRAVSYYYSFNGSTNLPVASTTLLASADESASVQALLCLLDVDYDAAVPVQGCSMNTSDPLAAGYVNGKMYMITLLARGQSDAAESMVREQLSNFGGTAGGQAPAVPLVTRSSFPPSGTAEVVANPNAGGVGVPVSVWMNNNATCPPGGDVVDPTGGSWTTCEAQEWYGTDAMPADYTCPGNCQCAFDEAISSTHAGVTTLGIDLVIDDEFPCDLFKFYFGVPKSQYEIIKGLAKVLKDCSTLDSTSAGIYWISGPLCLIDSNTTVGSPNAAILLISAATETRLRGGVKIYGGVYISDAEDINAAAFSQGTNTIYGQAIIDADLGDYTGTFQVIYNANLVAAASGQGGLGSVIGGWADFHEDWR